MKLGNQNWEKHISRIAFFAVLMFLSSLLISCDKNRVFEEYRSIPDNQWNAANKVSFRVNIADTVTPQNIYILLRNTGSYPYSNLFLFLTTRLPDGTFSKDTVECTLAKPDGTWLGEGLGDLWDNKFLFKRNFKFPHSGTWQFEYIQAMRISPLPCIADVGLRIENAVQK